MNQAASFTSDSLTPFVQVGSDKSINMNLFIRGMKCGHCVHKISNLVNEFPQVHNFEISLSTQSLKMDSDQINVFPKIIDQINQLGFEAIPLTEKNRGLIDQQEYKSDLKKLAVAGVCAGNIMLFSTAVYLGAEPGFRHFFHWLSFILAIPSLTYSSAGIFRGFFRSIQYRQFNLDLPIGLALVVGFILSFVSLLGNQERIYFDSLATVVFIILVSRFVLKNYVRSALSFNILQFVPGVYQARVERNGKTQVIALNKLKPFDVVVVHPGEILPVDGHLQEEKAWFDESVLTGESLPIEKSLDETVYAGTRCGKQKVKIQCSKVGEDSRVGRMITESLLAKEENSEVFTYINYFTVFVVFSALAVFSFFGFQGLWSEAFNRSFAMVLIACPCAVSFGFPLIRSGLGRLARESGMVIKEPQKLKLLKEIKHIVFDKTGTLTHGQPEIDKAAFRTLSKKDQHKLISLELQMDHPISNGFRKLRKPGSLLLPVENFEYLPGLGIRGEIQKETWSVESSHQGAQKTLQILKNHKPLVKIPVHIGQKENIESLFAFLSEKGKKISVLSGDIESEVKEVFKKIPDHAKGLCQSQALPEDKTQSLKRLVGKKLMVGDGFNDIAALQKADFSVSMPGALENSLRVADVSLLQGSLLKIKTIFDLSDRLVRTEKRLLVFTSFYNLTTLSLAALGYVSPLVAAILMPISSISVLFLVNLSLRRT